MTETTTEHTFHCTVERLYAVLVDPTTYPEWLVGAKTIRSVDEAWPEKGSEFRHVVGFGPIEIPDRTTSIEVVPNRVLALHVRARPAIEARVRFEVESVGDGSSCRLRMLETPVGVYRLVSPLAAPLVKARNEKSVRNLEGVVERGAPPPATA